jgi:hypothetical protein
VTKHLPSVTWPLRRYRDDQFPRIEVTIFEGAPLGHAISLARADARLLARRINECLEASK